VIETHASRAERIRVQLGADPGPRSDYLRRLIIEELEAATEPLLSAAGRYYDGWVQDEADDRVNCISDEQHEAAQALRDALGRT